jgi:hypothetical protein
MESLFREQLIIPIVAIISGCGIGAVAMVASFWYKLRVKQWEMSLKHSMLERGMSAEEIKTVLKASVNDRNCHDWWAKSCHTGKDA